MGKLVLHWGNSSTLEELSVLSGSQSGSNVQLSLMKSRDSGWKEAYSKRDPAQGCLFLLEGTMGLILSGLGSPTFTDYTRGTGEGQMHPWATYSLHPRDGPLAPMARYTQVAREANQIT
jgi:hypothetical protein